MRVYLCQQRFQVLVSFCAAIEEIRSERSDCGALSHTAQQSARAAPPQRMKNLKVDFS